MSVITAYPSVSIMSLSSSTSSCAASSISSGNKRKRSTSLHVRFCSEAPQVEYTYSQSDYDRSGLFPTVTSQDIEKIYNNPVIVAVSINITTPTTTTTTTTTVPQPPAPRPMKRSKQQKPPRLSIDTSNIHGPLFFTNMTTNHQKKSLVPPTPITPVDQQDNEQDQ
ncbi:hypothetical protein BDA99DRAFT_508164 [Phascolomyces articulosus]|uniref:Uncharacterized protein n=1 Tax=Phascolomyces articulosus TaxID=60185 RepID=A0AAD5KC11_9FUNG|nr:hypothetical protein BDA99DRAFT_508164 [Phascolomyces articulosus]